MNAEKKSTELDLAATNPERPIEPYSGLKDVDRARGYFAWQLIGDWKRWVRRRVESISYETSTSIRRRVSVDMRLIPELFGNAALEWGEQRVHYVPIAMLRKRRLVAFDLRDEQDQAMPLITMSRNAAITAAMLSAAAQSIARDKWNVFVGSDGPTPNQLVVPSDLEGAFLALAYLNPRDSDRGEGALTVYRRLTATSTGKARSIDEWNWREDETGRWQADASPDDWRALLKGDDNFLRLAWDVTRLFMVCVPLPYEEGRRRIVKFSYTEYLSQASERSSRSSESTRRQGWARAWNYTADRLEGLPVNRSPRADEWVPPLDEDRSGHSSFTRKLGEVIGWRTQVGSVQTPAVSHGSSYHISITTPNGIQIRAAALEVSEPEDNGPGAQDETGISEQRARDGNSGQATGARAEAADKTADRDGRDAVAATTGNKPLTRVQRGNRNLRAVDLHVSDPKPFLTAKTVVYIRPESSLIVRGGFCCSALVAAALTLLWLFSARVTADDGKHTEAVAAALVVIPGLLTVLAARDTEHPLATSMVFGVRALAMIPGVLAVLAAGQVIAGSPGSWFGFLLLSLAWLIALVLGVAWWLSARGQPEPADLWHRPHPVDER